ncbi:MULTISPECIES: tRNA (adenosine(37)-N6)-threonylcarbamoyltransferase complex transferase subunit TsaD [Sphingobacterium]|jgi:N6-L-threonylcarbamoyladenine synthase|uniref:tRNA N6-adenosine threonylcarbamoyltransferase n=1 Tax=Sphingobacterium multivorum TaxID=28454 RepID=A0A2X2IX64_SPHMU|nr:MULTISPECIES: tRNA (adenosine(37)-N6)-threonylcarbamoyltransferase complex transferase subunit TsaD [Sphingobacterium]HAE67837.1 tRNA (adenosine(37)-N6)-threonylcarbamoyltransferase complex transferase subunit TsaD [Sphingobacterium sp.]KKO91048.1 tRNA threonylcarbamoyladenosine biosynthesis protein Gcp [Sphingobacterium sp. Ag1]MDF2853402.1 tRNA ((37)-N6)-threonylcarbamoyltransferase complex transferase subunit TsaD [Sphingobacterium multivorum]OFV15904.1 N(6)-L-threonylcarbamoyladenine syn
MAIILGIESSCDETSASICINGEIHSNVIATQAIHAKYGGVIPELASRAHQQNIIPTVEEAIRQAKVSKNQIDAVSFTRGPGLLGALLVGTSFAKSFALAQNIPLIDINHMQAHILAHFIEDPKPNFPFLCLTVSGGHTQIVLVKDYFEMELLGETLDDAAGEAFDKTAKILNLPYPGGPLIDKFAREGNSAAYKLPEPQIPGLNFSFSGLKTAILYLVQDQLKQNPDFLTHHMADLCASVQSRIVSILLNKLKKAAKETGVKDIAIAGGVSANSGLRQSLIEMGEKYNWRVFIPKFEYCTDNAAMIAIAGYHKFLKKDFVGQDVAPMARMHL